MLNEAFRSWLDANAEALDTDEALAATVVPQLAQAGVLGHGIAPELGGRGGAVSDAIEAIAQVGAHSLAAAFNFWGQRVLIQLLADTDNGSLRAKHLPRLLAGEVAGASGLSNIMKFLSGIEALNIRATDRAEGGWSLQGNVPWCTNVRKEGFLAAVAVAREGAPPMIVALPSDRAGLERSPDLDLIALRGTNTAALKLQDVAIDEGDLLAAQASSFLPRVRPAFLGLQCGMSIGLARASLAVATQRVNTGRPNVLTAPLQALAERLKQATQAVKAGVDSGLFVTEPRRLFRLRLDLHECVQQAVQLELQASGGRAYNRDPAGGFARRWRESAFVPIVTPSVTQLLGELEKQPAGQAAAATPAAAPAGAA